MKESICIWDGCKEKIKLDDSFETSSPGQNLGVEVVGWCALHSLAYRKEHILLKKYYPKMEPHEASNKLYKTNRKRLNQISKEAENLAKVEMKC